MTSPNENVKLHFWLDEQGRPTYEMTFKDRPVVLPSHLGLVLAKDKHASRGLKETDLMDGFDIAKPGSPSGARRRPFVTTTDNSS